MICCYALPQPRPPFPITRKVSAGREWLWLTANLSLQRPKCSGPDTPATFTCRPRWRRLDWPPMVCRWAFKSSGRNMVTTPASTLPAYWNGIFKGSFRRPDLKIRFRVSAPPPAKKTAGLIEKETNSSPRSSQPPAHRAYHMAYAPASGS